MKKTFLSIVEEKLSEKKPGYRSWFDCLDEDAQEELTAIKSRFLSGEYGATTKSAMARAIIAAASERGWKTSGMQGVIHWLNQ